MRIMLENKFINDAFGQKFRELQELIALTSSGKVFLLTTTEAQRYFSSDKARICTPTAYAKAHEASVFNNGACNWLLSSSDHSLNFVEAFDGLICNISGSLPNQDNSYWSLRPAMWIVLNP